MNLDSPTLDGSARAACSLYVLTNVCVSNEGSKRAPKEEASDEDEDTEYFDAMEDSPAFITVTATENTQHRSVPCRHPSLPVPSFLQPQSVGPDLLGFACTYTHANLCKHVIKKERADPPWIFHLCLQKYARWRILAQEHKIQGGENANTHAMWFIKPECSFEKLVLFWGSRTQSRN